MGSDPEQNQGKSAIQAALEGDLERILALQAAGKPLSARDRGVLRRELERERAAEEQDEGNEGSELQLSSDAGPGFSFPTTGAGAAAYGYSERQIKNWKREGRLRGLPCPLERPEEMPAWFEAVFAPRACPDRLRDAVARLIKTRESGGAIEGEAPGSEPAALPAPKPPPVVSEDEVGFEATLNRARRREALLDKRLQVAIEENSPRADSLETQWGKAASRVRELEKAAPAILEAQGIYLRRSEVKAALIQIAGAMPKTARVVLRKLRRQLQEAKTAEEYEAAVDEAVNEIFSEMCSARFADPLELEMAG